MSKNIKYKGKEKYNWYIVLCVFGALCSPAILFGVFDVLKVYSSKVYFLYIGCYLLLVVLSIGFGYLQYKNNYEVMNCLYFFICVSPILIAIGYPFFKNINNFGKWRFWLDFLEYIGVSFASYIIMSISVFYIFINSNKTPRLVIGDKEIVL